MAVAKSPFYVVENFLSIKLCEQFVDAYGFDTYPDVNKDGKPLKMIKHSEEIQEIVHQRVLQLVPNLEKYYGDFIYLGTEPIMLEYYVPGVVPEPVCENSHWIRKKWVRTRDRDLSGIIFLSDYQDKVPFDKEYEVYGGKLEFLQHKFSFNPQRGTLVIYPSGPHFINAISEIRAGELYLIKLHMGGKLPFIYQPANFPGDYRSWFAGIL